MVELLASPITTHARATRTASTHGEVVAVARRDHLCFALSRRLGLPDGSIDLTDVVIRDAVADILKKAKKTDLSPGDYFNPKKPRMSLPGPRPVSCETKKAAN